MKITKSSKIQICAAHVHSPASYGVLSHTLSRMLIDNGHKYIVTSSLMGGNIPSYASYEGAKLHDYPQRQTTNMTSASSSSNDMVFRTEMPDLMIAIMNPRLLDKTTYSGRNSVMWTPSETKEMMWKDIEVMKHASAIWGMSKYVTESIKRRLPNGNVFYVPCAIDSAFRPQRKKESREFMCAVSNLVSLVNNPATKPGTKEWDAHHVMPARLQDAFIFGSVGANSKDPSRKRFYDLVSIFALVLKEIPNAYLYLHTASVYGEAWWIHAKNLGVDRRILCPKMELYDLNMFRPEHMAMLYSAMDVTVTAENGAGFGLPPVEGMACGIPFIGLEHSSLTEHTHPELLVRFKPEYLVIAPNHDAEQWWQFAEYPIAQKWIRYARMSKEKKENHREWALGYASQYYPQNVYDNYIAPFFETFDFPHPSLSGNVDIEKWMQMWIERAKF